MTWKAYAESDFVGKTRLHIWRGGSPHARDVITGLHNMGGATIVTETLPDGALSMTPGLQLDYEVSEAIYRALDRLFGKEHKVDDLKEALDVERKRVNEALTALIKHATS